MSIQESVSQAQKTLKEQPWQLYASQVAVLVRNEVRRNLFTRRRIWVYFLALIPVIIILIHYFVDKNNSPAQIEEDGVVLAGIVQLYYFRLGIFFACMGIFTWLFRGEMVERTLHYQFLVPVRKEVLVVGKFLAGAIISIALFETAVLACFYLTYSRFGSAGRSYVFDGPGLGQLGSYLLVTALACLGYGAVFLALSLLFKNPIIPGVMLMGWEAICPIFPAWAQRLSVTFYLKNLCPVNLPADGPLAIFTIVAEPVSPFLAVFGLLCLTLAILVLSCFLIHRLEITYTAE
ncbi:MAG TPA: ABC transporter permease [Candidatus Acidoferrum sp.]|jgi:ABC-type transport system involved in multi-copper enzyme maturation permease subunit|nr:ABC transporter permease [Candidatus Acidoferrum sp.]